MKTTLFSLLLLFSRVAFAGSSCDDILGEQNFDPLKIKEGIVCFVEQPALDEHNNQYGTETVVYFIAQDRKPMKAQGEALFNEGGNDAGKIVDAFELDINHDGKDEIVVIHFVEVRSSLAEQNSSNKFYDVTVFNKMGEILSRNDRASEWFGYGYSWLSDGKSEIYEFPYLTQQSVRQALASPFAELMTHDKKIPVIIKQKSYLYETPMIQEKTKKYLIAGDKATIDKYKAGWCQVTYSGGKKSLKMWMKCEVLQPDTGK